MSRARPANRPLKATATVAKYRLTISKNDEGDLTAVNLLADVEGRLELYDARVLGSEFAGEGPHASVEARRTLPAHLSQWRIAVSSNLSDENFADAFLLNCTAGSNACSVAAQAQLRKTGAILVVDEPEEGNWRVVIRSRDRTKNGVQYKLKEATLTRSRNPLENGDAKRASGFSWSVALPPSASDAQYAAFHIVGTPVREGTYNSGAKKNGLRIALTPLDRDPP